MSPDTPPIPNSSSETKQPHDPAETRAIYKLTIHSLLKLLEFLPAGAAQPDLAHDLAHDLGHNLALARVNHLNLDPTLARTRDDIHDITRDRVLGTGVEIDLSHALALAHDLEDMDLDPTHIHILNLALELARLLTREIRGNFVHLYNFAEILNSDFLEELAPLFKSKKLEELAPSFKIKKQGNENDEQPQ
jgi:hypothetical protein